MNRAAILMMVVLAGSISLPAQNTFVVHFDSIQNGNPGQPSSVIELDDGGFLLSGIQDSHDTTGQLHVFLRRTDTWGIVISEREIHENDPRVFNSAGLGSMVRDDSLFVVGVTRYAPSSYECSLLLYKYNEDGDTLSTHELLHYSPQDSVFIQHLRTILVSSGGYLLIGGYEDIDNSAQILLVRVTQNGDTMWTKQLGDQYSDVGYSICELQDGGFALSAIHSGGGPSNDHTLIRTDSLGNQLWRRQFGELGSGIPSVRMTPDGNILTFTGHKESVQPSAWSEVELRKWNLNGVTIWSKFSHRTINSDTWPRDFEVLDDGSIITSISYGRTAMFAKFDANGDSLWSRFYYVFSETNNYNEAIINDIDPTSDGGYVMCGWKIQDQGDPTDGLQTWFLIKTDSLGCGAPGCQTLGVNEFVIGLQEHLKIFPNPVETGHTVTVELAPPGGADLGPVELVVQDVMGREVRRENMVRTEGVSTFSFPVSAFSPGPYLLHLVSEGKWLAGGKLLVE